MLFICLQLTINYFLFSLIFCFCLDENGPPSKISSTLSSSSQNSAANISASQTTGNNNSNSMSSPSLGLTNTKVTNSTAKSTGSAGVVSNIPMVSQYIQTGMPFYQQPVYSYEDIQMLQQRIPPHVVSLSLYANNKQTTQQTHITYHSSLPLFAWTKRNLLPSQITFAFLTYANQPETFSFRGEKKNIHSHHSINLCYYTHTFYHITILTSTKFLTFFNILYRSWALGTKLAILISQKEKKLAKFNK